jgi:hypothetical protein
MVEVLKCLREGLEQDGGWRNFGHGWKTESHGIFYRRERKDLQEERNGERGKDAEFLLEGTEATERGGDSTYY